MKSFIKILSISGRRSIDALIPPLCPLTDERIDAPGGLSAAGWGRLHFLDDPLCARCGAPFAHDYGAEAECAACIANPPDFDRARAAVAYDDASHGLIVSFKHADRTDLAPMFAGWLRRAGAGLFTPDAIVAPVPLHRRRLFARRYNQAAMLAGLLARDAGLAFAPGLLTRVRATPPQKELSADARRRNVAGAFAVGAPFADAVAGAHVILIDDVLTTGATLSACARTLRRAGAARVDALVIARVVRGGPALG
ncbi:MAG: ComF family protein [Parvularculaceae bacterium]|nr:ComF family protein [Parvularculaceae bacterium]